MPDTRSPIITLTTDFGTGDHYVGSMKGAIYSVVGQVNIVDFTHEVPPHDILSAAFMVRAAFNIFPPTTIHVVVVDPGVGTERRPIIVSCANHQFVGPDNGVFSLIYESNPDHKVYHITATHYFRERPSPTFHGRDVFAPVAAQLARGIGVEKFGEPIEDPVKIDVPRPKVTSEGRVRATIIHVDRFGNLVTNITQGALDSLMKRLGKSQIKGAGKISSVTEMHTTYAEAAEGSAFLLFDSSSHLEIATGKARADALLGLKSGDPVEMELY